MRTKLVALALNNLQNSFLFEYYCLEVRDHKEKNLIYYPISSATRKWVITSKPLKLWDIQFLMHKMRWLDLNDLSSSYKIPWSYDSHSYSHSCRVWSQSPPFCCFSSLAPCPWSTQHSLILPHTPPPPPCQAPQSSGPAQDGPALWSFTGDFFFLKGEWTYTSTILFFFFFPYWRSNTQEKKQYAWCPRCLLIIGYGFIITWKYQ